MFHGPERTEIPFSGEYLEVEEPTRLVTTLKDPGNLDSPDVEVLTTTFTDLGNATTELTYVQSGGNLPAEEYGHAMQGSLIFFERLAALVEEEEKD